MRHNCAYIATTPTECQSAVARSALKFYDQIAAAEKWFARVEKSVIRERFESRIADAVGKFRESPTRRLF